jgi:opacity protein-like surface antigen
MQRRLPLPLPTVLAIASVGASLAAGALPRASHAQPGAPLPAPRFGVMAGVNSSTIALDPEQEGVARRTGFIGGVYLNFPLGATLSVQPELLYSMKGADSDDDIDDPADFHQDYLELPVLLRADFAAGSAVRPYLFAGPTFSYRVRCNVSGQGISIDCDEFTDTPGEDIPEFKKFDLGAALGGGVTFGVGTGSALNLGVRYTLGASSFTDPAPGNEGDEAKNRALSFTVGLEFPLGRR